MTIVQLFTLRLSSLFLFLSVVLVVFSVVIHRYAILAETRLREGLVFVRVITDKDTYYGWLKRNEFFNTLSGVYPQYHLVRFEIGRSTMGIPVSEIRNIKEIMSVIQMMVWDR
jgi:hypothetical protein